MRLLFLLPLIAIQISFASVANIEQKIDNNKKILEKNSQHKKQTEYQIKKLSDEISTQTNSLKKLEKKMSVLSRVILQQKDKLEKTKTQLSNLEAKAEELKKEKVQKEERIIDLITEDFSWAFALNLASKKSLNELIDAELYDVLSQNSKDEIIQLNKEYLQVSQEKVKNEKAIDKLQQFIAVETKRKKNLSNLQAKQEGAIASLQKKHTAYQYELKKSIKKQQSLSNLLGKLNILKKEEIAKQQERERKLALEKKKREQESAKSSSSSSQKRFANNIDLDVRMIGSSTAGVKIGRYRGSKTIAPLKSYTITKKFGKYYDPVYKIKLFNESVVMKSKQPKAKVFSVLNGKVVYAKKDSGMLENVVIVQHKNGLHTIYSHLDQISPTIKVGKWIQKGYVVGRVDDSLTFQATKNSAHINPQDLFN